MNNHQLPTVGTDGEIRVGHYVATATVSATRRNLFVMEPGKERHIGTLIAGSRSKVAEFELDCMRIVAALAVQSSNADESMTANPLWDAAPDLLATLKFAVARVRLANDEGDPILSAWLPGAQAIISKADGRADSITPPPSGSVERTLDALNRAERFLSGFEDDSSQQGIDDDLDAIRTVIAALELDAVAGVCAAEPSGREQ